MMDNEKIINQLVFFEKQNANKYSLYHGKTGLSIAYSLLYASLKDEIYLTKAMKLIDEVCEVITEIQDLSFESGLSGIGWGIEWLIQNKFIAIDKSIVLDDIDSELYKVVTYIKSSSLSITSGTIGRALYFYRRLAAPNPCFSRTQIICNTECLVLLIDEIKDLLLNQNDEILLNESTLNSRALCEIGQTLLFLSRMKDLQVNTEMVKESIDLISRFLNSYFLSKEFVTENEKVRSYIIYSFLKAGFCLNNNDFIDKGQELYQLYIYNSKSRHEQFFFSDFLIIKLLFANSIKEECLSFDNLGISVFTILNTICLLPGTSTYNWEEGWGF